MIIVTGAAGFIGSNIIRALNKRGYKDVIAVDDLTDGSKFVNLVDCDIADYLDMTEFRTLVVRGTLEPPEIIFHNGACSSTTETNGKMMLDNNFTVCKELSHYCKTRQIRFIYASSAAVYGGSCNFTEDSQAEFPQNVYGYSKLLFDRYVTAHNDKECVQVVGLRYFNVYGPREQHKGPMASVMFQFQQQVQRGENIELFGEYDGWAAGMQSRDFVHVDDVVSVNLWFWEHPELSGIFNVGTGRTVTFLDVATLVADYYGRRGLIYFKQFPEGLKGHYQSYTCANISKLRQVGYDHQFKTVAEGVREYLTWLSRKNNSS